MNLRSCFREPVNTWTHFFGFIFSFLGAVMLIAKAATIGDAELIGAFIYSAGLLALYGASSLYHGLKGQPSTLEKLRKIDHAMIFFLIAATYTPICLVTLQGIVGWVLLAVIWFFALIGAILKFTPLRMPRWLSTGIYVLLGWGALSVIYPLYTKLPTLGFISLVAGGLFYTLGAVIYAKKPTWIQFGPWGFHEVFHIFILLGSISHYLLIYIWVIA